MKKKEWTWNNYAKRTFLAIGLTIVIAGYLAVSRGNDWGTSIMGGCVFYLISEGVDYLAPREMAKPR